VTQVNEDVLLERIEGALSAGLLVEVPRSKGLFKFADNRIRELLLDDLSQIRKAKYHLRIAEGMEKTYASNLESHAGSIGTHFAEGGDIERGVKYSVIAGDRNRSIHAYEQALNDYRRALDLIDIEGGREEQKAYVCEALGDCYTFAGQRENGIKFYKSSLEIFERLRDKKGYVRACVGIVRAIFRSGQPVGIGLREGIESLKLGLSFLRDDAESYEAATLYSRLAYSYAVLDEWDEALKWADRGLEVGKKTGNIAAVVGALATKSAFLTDTGKVDEGLLSWQQALELALANEFYDGICDILNNLSIYTYPRDLKRAREYAVQHAEHHRRANDLIAEAHALIGLASVDMHAGDWKTAREQYTKAAEITERLGLAPNHFWYNLELGWFSFSTGDLERAERYFQESTRLASQETKITPFVAAHLGVALLRLEQGRKDEARQHLEKCVDAFKKWEFTTDPLLHIETLLHLTSLYAKNNLQKANEFAKWARRLAETIKSDAGIAMALQAEAHILSAEGNRERALDAYEQSINRWEKAGWPYDRAKGLLEYAQLLEDTNPDQSARKLKEAVSVLSELGAKRDLEKAQAQLRVLDGRSTGSP
jgi:tetratricopeptide (TPR) repeat protein